MTRTLLIVDDIKSNREILKNMLRNEYEIIEAAHGEEALAVMTKRYQEISAVLLDLGMPVMDGYEVLYHMQQNEQLSSLPVIVTTGQTDAGSEEKALKLGAKDYISKPYKSAIIRQRIWNTINLRETAAAINAMKRDMLTGLYSRDAFFEKTREEVLKHPAGFYIMACFDINKFKVINDQYGTEKGDEILIHIANVFKNSFESIGGFCCRVSSDDFAVLYPTAFADSDELAEARKKAGKISGLASEIVFSIGRYIINDLSLTPSAMYDRAMLAAESVNGKYDERVAYYDETMREHLIREQEIVTEMQAALTDHQFEIWFQPQYNHSTKALIGSEALVRWRHPQKGLVPPGLFVPIFEQNGFIYALDRYVWEGVCEYLHEELEKGSHPLPISVNISRYDVFQDDFVDVINSLVKKYAVPVSLLRLEITESAFAESTSRIVSVVKQLIEYGFTLEIDDFGSGYSSLNTLKSVPAQVVKLDMRFLEDEDDSQRGGNIIESVVRMTKWLGMSVIAEGVETKAQADYLRSIGCNYIQGYFYAKPMPLNEYHELVHGEKSAKEDELLMMETVENLDNDSFWSPESMDTLIFNSYVGAACIYEYNNGKLELLRSTVKYAQILLGENASIDEILKLDLAEHFDEESLQRIASDIDSLIADKEGITGEYLLCDLNPSCEKIYIRSTMRIIARTGQRFLIYSINEDITAQKTAEQREKQLTKQLQSVMDNVACGLTAIRLQGENIDFILTNDTYYDILGYTEEQFRSEVDRAAFKTILPEDVQAVKDAVKAVNTSKKPLTVEYRALRRDNTVIWLRSHMSVGYFDDGDEEIQLCTYTDITEQKKAEQILRDTSAQLTMMMDDIPGGFARIKIFPNNSMKPVFINGGLSRLTGMNRDEFMTIYENDALSGVHPQDIEVVKTAVSEMLQNGEAHSYRYRLITKAGDYIWVSIFGRRTFDENNDTYLNIYYSDLTKQVEEETRQKELLDNMPYGAGFYEYTNDSLKIMHLNKRYWELVERKETLYSGTDFVNAVYIEDRNVISREVKLAINENRDVSCDVRILCGQSGYRPFHITGRIQKKDEGSYFIYAAYTPITEEEMSVSEMLPIALSAMMELQTGYSFIKDKNLRYIACSREAIKLFNMSSYDDILGKTDHEIFDDSLADSFTNEDKRVLFSGEAVLDYTVSMPLPNGGYCYTSTSKFPLKDSRGNTIGVYGVGYDITGAHAMRTRFELLSSSIPGGLATYEYQNGKLSLAYYNEGFCKLFDMTSEEYAASLEKHNKDVTFGIFDEDLPKLNEQIDALINKKKDIDCIYRVHMKGNTYKWINLRASGYEQNGDKITFNTVLFDVTQREEDREKLRISEEENRLAIQQSKNTVCRYDVENMTLRVPKAAQEAFLSGEIMENVPYSSIDDRLVSEETAEAYIKFYEDIRSGSKNGTAVFQRRGKNGWRWLEAYYSTIFSDDGKAISAVISYKDITEQLEKDSAYKRWQQSFSGRAPESYSLFRLNISEQTSFFERAGELLKISFPEGIRSFDDYTQFYVGHCVFAEDRERFTAFLNADELLAIYYRGNRIATIEYREASENGDQKWLRLTTELVEHPHTRDIEAYLLFEDIDEEKRRELATIEMAKTDPLTGVMNRKTFAAQVDNILKMNSPGTHHALLMLDIDNFKLVNDVFGHAAGDQTLTDVADMLKSVLRHDDLVGRLGGDEFVVFLSDIPADIIASTKAKQICALTRKSFSAEVEITGSIGIVVFPRDGDDFETLYKKADAALYHVKGSGRDGFMFYQEEMADEHLVYEEKGTENASSELPEKKRRMLIVDDSRIDHAMLTNIFADSFIIEKAKDGAAALIRLRHYGSAISVVLLDLMMPGMDGFTVLEKMQESTELKNIPVIVVSGDENRETGLRAIRSGAVDFVTKPVDAEILRIRVTSAISKAENERLRAKNSFLEYQNNEILRYKTALEKSDITVVEHDWIANTFIYDEVIGYHIAGNYDKRSIWHIFLSDMVAKTLDVKHMQELVQKIATEHKPASGRLYIKLKPPQKTHNWFKLDVYKSINEFGLTGKIYMTFTDLGSKKPEEAQEE